MWMGPRVLIQSRAPSRASGGIGIASWEFDTVTASTLETDWIVTPSETTASSTATRLAAVRNEFDRSMSSVPRVECKSSQLHCNGEDRPRARHGRYLLAGCCCAGVGA